MTQTDATWEALERIARDGSDLTRPLRMDFFVVAPNESSGNVIASRARHVGFSCSVEQDAEDGTWTCYCTKIIVARYQVVVEIERQLDNLARDVGGYSDGFGTFGKRRTVISQADAPEDAWL